METRYRLSGLAALCLSLVLLSCACAQGKPPESVPRPLEARTLSRDVAGEVVIDKDFFTPFLLEKGAPKAARSAYRSFVKGDEKEARKKLSAFLSQNARSSYAPQSRILLAFLLRKAGLHEEAVRHFKISEKEYPLLADHARYWGAQSAFSARNYEQTVSFCLGISLGSSFGPRSKFLRGRALLRQGHYEDAIRVLEEFRTQFPKASYLGDVLHSLAVSYEKAGYNQKAARLFHRMRIDYSGRSLEKDGEKGVKRLKKKLSKADADKIFRIKAGDRVQIARGLYKIHRSERAVAELAELHKTVKPRAGGKVWCDALFLEGQTYRKLRKHREASTAYGAFLKRCSQRSDTIKALYSSARSLWTIDEDKEALALFQRIWEEYPQHSYADDAVLYASRIHRSNGNDRKSAQLLSYQVERFEQGDMISDAHWYRFLDLYSAGKYARAVSYADEVRGKEGESTIYTRGRMSYFRARSLEALGKKSAAVEGFEEVLDVAPMSYYALLSLNRLKSLNKEHFEDIVERLTGEDVPEASWTLHPPQLAEDSRFKRGVELLRLGLFQEARTEFDQLRKHYPSKEQVLWVLTLLFDRAGAYHLSHDIPRRKIGSFGSTWPAGNARSQFELAFPRPFHDHVSTWSKKHGIPEALAYAIMREESGFNPRIESWANAYGLMQLILPTAREMAKASGMTKPKPSKLSGADLFQPAINVRLGTKFLSGLSEGYDNHPAVTIAGYNGGFGNVDRWLKDRGDQDLDLWVEAIPFGQTRHYTKRVLTTLWTYQWLYGKGSGEIQPSDRVIHVPMNLPKPSK